MSLTISRKKTLAELSVLFLLYTVLSLSFETVFTGVADMIRDSMAGRHFNVLLPCRASLWIIPVYAVSATLSFGVIGAFFPKLIRRPWWVRGIIYMFVIYAFEFVWALMIQNVFHVEVWRYRDSPHLVWRYINPCYCCFWFGFGFILEWVRFWVLPRFLS